MSLIVAAATPTSLLAVADTKVTIGDERTNPYLDGVAKLLLIDERRFLAFAGEVEPALTLLGTIEATDSEAQVRSKLLACTKIHDVEFIYGSLDPSPHLLHIADTTVSETTPSWIGDHAAFREYQRHFLSTDPNDTALGLTAFRYIQMPGGQELCDAALYSKMFHAMEAVIVAGTVPSVAGIITPILTRDNAISYGGYSCIYRRPIDASEIGPEPTIITFGDATTGSFSMTLTPIGPRSFVVHIAQAPLGVVYTPTEGRGIGGLIPEVIDGIDEIDFDEYVRCRFGKRPGIVFTNSLGSFGAKAVSELRAGKIQRAIDLLTRGIIVSSRTWKGNGHNSQTPYDSIQAWVSAEGSQPVIAPKEMAQLRTAFLLRAGLQFEIGKLDAAGADASDCAALGETSPHLTVLQQRVEIARVIRRGEASNE